MKKLIFVLAIMFCTVGAFAEITRHRLTDDCIYSVGFPNKPGKFFECKTPKTSGMTEESMYAEYDLSRLELATDYGDGSTFFQVYDNNGSKGCFVRMWSKDKYGIHIGDSGSLPVSCDEITSKYQAFLNRYGL